MFNFLNFLADVPGPFPYYEPNPATSTDLMPYIFGGLIVIAGITALVLLAFRPRKKKQEKK